MCCCFNSVPNNEGWRCARKRWSEITLRGIFSWQDVFQRRLGWLLSPCLYVRFRLSHGSLAWATYTLSCIFHLESLYRCSTIQPEFLSCIILNWNGHDHCQLVTTCDICLWNSCFCISCTINVCVCIYIYIFFFSVWYWFIICINFVSHWFEFSTDWKTSETLKLYHEDDDIKCCLDV